MSSPAYNREPGSRQCSKPSPHWETHGESQRLLHTRHPYEFETCPSVCNASSTTTYIATQKYVFPCKKQTLFIVACAKSIPPSHCPHSPPEAQLDIGRWGGWWGTGFPRVWHIAWIYREGRLVTRHLPQSQSPLWCRTWLRRLQSGFPFHLSELMSLQTLPAHRFYLCPPSDQIRDQYHGKRCLPVSRIPPPAWRRHMTSEFCPHRKHRDHTVKTDLTQGCLSTPTILTTIWQNVYRCAPQVSSCNLIIGFVVFWEVEFVPGRPKGEIYSSSGQPPGIQCLFEDSCHFCM